MGPVKCNSRQQRKSSTIKVEIIEIKCGYPVTLDEVEEYGENMGNFDEEAQPFEHIPPIEDYGITHNSYTDEVHAMPD